MPISAVRNRIPRLRPGVRDETKLDRHERAVLDALYRAVAGATFNELHDETRIGKGPLLAALQRLGNRTRCAKLGCSTLAVDRTDRDAPLAPLYTVTNGWLLTHRPHGLRS
jgi:hypothetical protein